MDRFTEMETFVAVVEQGSLSGAAKRLGIAVSAVSRRIDELEARLGARLAQRSTRGFAPTPLGREFYDSSVRLLSDVAETEARARGDQQALRGLVRLAAPLSFGMKHVAPVVIDAMVAAPDLTVDLDLNDRRIDLVSEGYDFAVRIGTMMDSTLVARKLFPVQHILAASPAFWDRYGLPATADDLAGLPALVYRGGDVGRQWRYRDPDGRDGQVTVNPVLMSSNGDVVALAAQHALGAVLEPAFILAEAIADGSLVPALADHQWFDMSAHIVYASGRPLPARARFLMDQLVTAFQRVPPGSTAHGPVSAAAPTSPSRLMPSGETGR